MTEPGTKTCKNCGSDVTGKYCIDCGQRTNVPRITIGYLLSRLFIQAFDLDGPFIKTIKKLLFRPGKSIRKYIEGQRTDFFNPGKLLLIFGALSTLVVMRYNAVVSTTQEDITFLSELGIGTKAFFEYAQEYNTLVNVLAIPVFALFTWVFFKSRFNYAENLVLNTYISAMQLGLLVLVLPLIELVDSLQSEIIAFYSIVTIAYFSWTVLTFFDNLKLSGFIKLILIIICSYSGQFIFNFMIYHLIKNLI